MALISFDLDGVLQRNPFQGSRPDGVFGHIKRELAAYVQSANPESDALELVYREHHDRMYGNRMVACFDWDDIVATVAARLGAPFKLDVGALVDRYAVDPTLCYLYPGAAECLQTLTDAGYTLVTTTNGYKRYQEPVLRQLGILHFFRAMISPEMAGAAKPETGIFRAAEAYGAPRIHIGDTLPHDVAGAKRAGWQVIYIVQPGAPGFTELPPALTAMAPMDRPAQALEWLGHRLEKERGWHGHPPAELPECIPDAIVTSLAEIPATVAALLSR
ncbi:MAG TPA: HAD family hydrolase [Symbiobacteriaceae bacterium]|nr:HAD family hydrolase [Symbiobacteriaceae bacterium]